MPKLISTQYLRLLFIVPFLFSGCETLPPETPARQPGAAVALPEPMVGINIFVTTELVPLALTAQSTAAPSVAAPDPFKANAFDEEAPLEMQSRVHPWMMDLRERLHLPFRSEGLAAQSYVTGARYAWDELRRDRHNYRLSVWPTRSVQAGDAVDLRFSLMNESTGRVVWTRVQGDAFGLSGQPGPVPQVQRIAAATRLAADTLAAMRRDGILPGRD